MVWYGMVWYGMVWYGMVWYGKVWYGMIPVPVLLTVIGGKTYSLLGTLTFHDKPSTKSFDQIKCQSYKGHLSPKPLLNAERFRFHKWNQRDDKNILIVMWLKLRSYPNTVSSVQR
jgi:hypothetical protein